MKKLLFTGLLLIAVSFYSSAQAVSSPTTEIEYNYITKGYKIQLESGLDMKVGYELKNIKTVDLNSYSFDIKALIRTKEKEIAALMVITKSSVWGTKSYLCIPHGNAALSNRYNEDLNKWGGPATAYSFVMSSMLSELSAQIYDLEKPLKK